MRIWRVNTVGEDICSTFALLLEHLMMHVSDPKFYENEASRVCNFIPFQNQWEVPTDQFIKWADVYISNGNNLEIVMRFGFDNLIWYYIALTKTVFEIFHFCQYAFCLSTFVGNLNFSITAFIP